MSFKEFERLKTSIDWSISQLKVPREQRVKAVKQYVGSHYAQSGSDLHVPVNLIELAVTIYVRNLAARAPRIMVKTGTDTLKPFARSMEIALNQIPNEIGLGETIRGAVVEALFGVGVVKVGLCSSGHEIEGHDAGEPFVDVVTLDDYFVDMNAKSRRGAQYEGNDYWVDIETARAMQEEGGQKAEPDEHTVTGDQGERRAEGVSTDEGGATYRDRVWLRDVWLPGKRKMLTYGIKSGRLFRAINWDGPEHGPYHSLRYTDVPGNILPLPPAMLWIDLHEIANRSFRKLARQADAKKTVAAFAGGNDTSVKALKAARDGDGINYSGPKPEAITVGGIDQAGLAFFLQTKDLLSYMGGNLDALGGLSPMTDTVGQDKMLSESASARMNSMKSETTRFAAGIFESLAWYEWTDPVRKRVVGKPVEGTDIVLRREWSQETREGDFLDFNLELDPYSMTEDTPASKLQKLLTTLERVVFPMLPEIQRQGGELDVRSLMGQIANHGGLDELRELVKFGEPIEGDPQQGGSETPSFKSPTHSVYERVNRPGATRAGSDGALTQALLGKGVQESEMSAIGRPNT